MTQSDYFRNLHPGPPRQPAARSSIPQPGFPAGRDPRARPTQPPPPGQTRTGYL